MSTIKLTATHIGQFLHARTLSTSGAKQARKGIWASIRDVYRIPKDIKLGVDLDNSAGPFYGVLYQKGTRLLLNADQYGAYSGLATAGTIAAGTIAAGTTTTQADVNPPAPEVSVVNSTGLARYVTVKADDIKTLADSPVCYSEIVQRPDCGRIAYDKDTDSVLVRLDA